MLAGRLALVTGGARGIGQAICEVFDREGAQVVTADLEENICNCFYAELDQSGHMAIQMDVTDSESVANGLKAIVDKYKKPPCIIVNCAGIFKMEGFLTELTEEQFDKTMNVNSKGTFLVNKMAASLMKEHQISNGSIINISSIAGKKAVPGYFHYGASKAAVISMTRTAATELAKHGIRVNCICPGLINTRMMDEISKERLDKTLATIPLGKLGEPEDVAETAAFMASDRAKYMTGAVIDVNGGLL